LGCVVGHSYKAGIAAPVGGRPPDLFPRAQWFRARRHRQGDYPLAELPAETSAQAAELREIAACQRGADKKRKPEAERQEQVAVVPESVIVQ